MLVGRAFLRSQMPVLFLAIGFALGVQTSPETTAASAIRQLQPDGTESVQSVLPDASGNCPQGTCPIGTCPQGTCPHGPKPAGTKPAGTKPAGTRPYETREKATINSCVPDKSAPDCPMPPVCGDCESGESGDPDTCCWCPDPLDWCSDSVRAKYGGSWTGGRGPPNGWTKAQCDAQSCCFYDPFDKTKGEPHDHAHLWPCCMAKGGCSPPPSASASE